MRICSKDRRYGQMMCVFLLDFVRGYVSFHITAARILEKHWERKLNCKDRLKILHILKSLQLFVKALHAIFFIILLTLLENSTAASGQEDFF